MIVKLPKKGNLSDCNNQRQARSSPECCSTDSKMQWTKPFVKSKKASKKVGQQIFALRNIIKQSLEHQKDLVINFIDFKKAFDSVHRPSLWKILKHYGIPARTSASSKHCTIIPAAQMHIPDAQTSLK